MGARPVWLAALAVALAGCNGSYVTTTGTGGSGGSGATADTTTVRITDNAFEPDSVTVAAGKTVSWTNYGTGPHSSTSNTLLWDSHQLNGSTVNSLGQSVPGQSFSFTFGAAGRYPYHDTVDSLLTGVVVVTP